MGCQTKHRTNKAPEKYKMKKHKSRQKKINHSFRHIMKTVLIVSILVAFVTFTPKGQFFADSTGSAFFGRDLLVDIALHPYQPLGSGRNLMKDKISDSEKEDGDFLFGQLVKNWTSFLETYLNPNENTGFFESSQSDELGDITSTTVMTIVGIMQGPAGGGDEPPPIPPAEPPSTGQYSNFHESINIGTNIPETPAAPRDLNMPPLMATVSLGDTNGSVTNPGKADSSGAPPSQIIVS